MALLVTLDVSPRGPRAAGMAGDSRYPGGQRAAGMAGDSRCLSWRSEGRWHYL